MRRPFACVLLSLLGVSLPVAAHAQGKADKVRFTTVDGVEILGNFYHAKPQGPVVMLLHAFEGSSRTKDWTNLATGLQKAGYNVLSFDFRGHGESTEVIDPVLFWNTLANRNGIKNPNPKRTSIEAKDFKADYRTTMINDIAAAKAWLDRKNDSRDCNSGATVLIGAEEGATLGAIWLNQEFYRYRTIQKGAMFFPNKESEGHDVCACIWLTISPKLAAGGAGAVPLDKTLLVAGRLNAVPMVFMHGSEDALAKGQAKKLEGYLKEKAKLKYTGAYEIKGSKLTGAGLLKTPGTVDAITDWLGDTTLRAKEWQERDFLKTQNFWLIGGKQFPARSATDLNMMFDSYSKFIGGKLPLP